MHEITKTIPLFPEFPRQLAKVCMISKRQVPSEGIPRELICHRTGKLIPPFREQVFLQSIDSSQGLLVEQFRGGINLSLIHI